MSTPIGPEDADKVELEDTLVPQDVEDDWQPEGYKPGPDNPGDIDTECGDEL